MTSTWRKADDSLDASIDSNTSLETLVHRTWDELVAMNASRHQRYAKYSEAQHYSGKRRRAAKYQPSTRAIINLMGRSIARENLIPGTAMRKAIAEHLKKMRTKHRQLDSTPADKICSVQKSATDSSAKKERSGRPGKRRRKRLYECYHQSQRNSKSQEGDSCKNAEEQQRNHKSSSSRSQRHDLFAKWICETLVGEVGKTRQPVLDVAGGKGFLSQALTERGISCILVDPCALDGRNLCTVGHFTPETRTNFPTKQILLEGNRDKSTPTSLMLSEGASTSSTTLLETKTNCTKADVNSIQKVSLNLSSTDDTLIDPVKPGLKVLRKTLNMAANDNINLISGCSSIVGLHPDEATEEIVDFALRYQKPFAVIPCCVQPHLFPLRRLKSCGARVRKYGAFIDYLLEKDTRMQRLKLPFPGRNIVLFMTARDFRIVAPPRRMTVSVSQKAQQRACALAAKEGNLEKLKALRSLPTSASWGTDLCQCAAWAGHLHILEYAFENGCPWNWAEVAAAATRGGHEHVVKWAVTKGRLVRRSAKNHGTNAKTHHKHRANVPQKRCPGDGTSIDDWAVLQAT